MRKLSFILVVLFFQIRGFCQMPTLQERLGYSRDSKLLIIHADDLGVSHSENSASTQAMENGSVTSASIMVPTPWFAEITRYALAHPLADLGLHLTLTSEWEDYKWAPVAGAAQVPGLVNRWGYMYSAVDSVYRTAQLAEVEKELRAQMEKARTAGIDFTHLDSHMGTLYANPQYLAILIKLGREYRLPVQLSVFPFKMAYGVDLKPLVNEQDVLAEMLYMASPADYKKGMPQFYETVIRSLKPGLSVIILHAAYDNGEMQAVTVGHPDYGAAWRQADFNYFTSDSCRKLLSEMKIHLVTWREIRDKLFRSKP